MKGRGWKKKRKMKYLILEINLYEPSFAEEKTVASREKLNKFLISEDISPIFPRNTMGRSFRADKKALY